MDHLPGEPARPRARPGQVLSRRLLVVTLLALVAAVVLVRVLGLTDLIRLENLARLPALPLTILFLCMLPATLAFTAAAGAGARDARRMLILLAPAGVLLVALSLLPRWLRGRSATLDDLLRSG